MALVLFSLAKEVTPELEQGLDDAVSLVSDLREIFEEEKIILVATKYDLMPPTGVTSTCIWRGKRTDWHILTT